MRITTGWHRLIPVAFAVFLMGAGGDRPPLVEAAKNGDRDALRALLQKKADVNAAEADGSTALHWASYRDDLESADLLIRAGANGERGQRSWRHAALDGQPERKRGHGPEAAGGRREPERGAAGRRDAADGGCPLGLSRRRRTTARQGRERERARRARPDGAHVGGSAEAPRCREGAARARRRRPGPLGGLERGDGRAAAWLSPNTTARSRTAATPR